MNRSEVLEIVKNTLVDECDVNVSDVEETTRIKGDLALDSLDVVELVMAIEDEFDISMPDEILERIKTVGQLVDEIQKLKGAA